MNDCNGIGNCNKENSSIYNQYELKNTNVVIAPLYKNVIVKSLTQVLCKILPNPASDYFELEITDDASHDLNIDLVNNSGKIVSSFNMSTNKNTIKRKVDLQEFSNGSYNVIISCNGNRIEVLQLVVVK
jgi:hypothetical protein